MSFELNPIVGFTSELDTDLVTPASHEREDVVVPKIKEGIKVIVDALGGYLSVSCNGNLNPISGETGEEVHIHIVSLSPPAGVSVPVVEDPILLNPENKFNGESQHESVSVEDPIPTPDPPTENVQSVELAENPLATNPQPVEEKSVGFTTEAESEHNA